ncbi:unnamed protein product [Urochloa humidicola]
MKPGGGKMERNMLVFDLGGGMFNLSVITINSGIFEVRATSGNTHLSSEDFDQLIIDFIGIIRCKHGKDIVAEGRARGRLRRECERAMGALSIQHVCVQIESLVNCVTCELPTRAKFEEVNSDRFHKAMAPVKRAMADAGLPKGGIDEMRSSLGGNTWIRKVRQLLASKTTSRARCPTAGSSQTRRDGGLWCCCAGKPERRGGSQCSVAADTGYRDRRRSD